MKHTDKRGKVLIIDDEAAIFDTLQTYLEDCHNLLYASSGHHGLHKVRTSRPDLILLDIGLPDIGGYELCSVLKADPALRHIPVIFLTASNSEENEAKGFELGAVDYIAKPVKPSIVKARVATHMELKQRQDYANSLVRLDGLTGIANRRGFDETLDREWRRAVRSQLPLSLVMMDIDAFKRYNDHYGHLAGDQCLQSVASCLKNSVHRGGDTLARYGGEEFAAILYDTPFEFVTMIAERFRRGVVEAVIPHAESMAANMVTISVGAATIFPEQGRSPDALIGAADAALYEVKEDGGNGVCARQVSGASNEPVIRSVPASTAAASGWGPPQ